MKYKNFFILIFLLLSTQSSSLADIPHFLACKYILNSSDAGKKAQIHLKKKLENGIKNISSKEKSILEEEKKIINQKKLITAEEYKKKS